MTGVSVALKAGVLVAALAAFANPANAVEGGATVYLLGSGGPGAAELPPLKGVYFANTLYRYEGKAEGGRVFPIGGSVVAGLEADLLANFATVLWVPATDLAGGTLALGFAMPLGRPDVEVSTVIIGPLGNQFQIDRSQANTLFGDPLLTAAWGWKSGRTSVQLSTLLNIPVGSYRDGSLSNVAFNRWALDTSLAATWRDEPSGWDVSGKAGVVFNGKNDATDYNSGDEFHVEAAVEKALSPKFSLGVQAYYLKQISDDSGPGARLGPFKGEVTGVGATAAYRFKVVDMPATLRLHALTEFNATNRLEGNSIFLDFSMPLHMVMPAGAP